MSIGKKVVDDKRVRKYIELARERLERARADGSPGKIIDKAERYLSDGIHYFDRGDNATALASISYSHGLLDGSVLHVKPGQPCDRSYTTRLLGAVFLGNLKGRTEVDQLAADISVDRACLESRATQLKSDGYLDRSGGSLQLTPSGRARIRVGFVAGVFDLIHPGHLAFLNWARERVDVLVVVVARDPNSQHRKGRKPIQGESDRLSLVSELKPVDIAIIGDQDDIYSPVLRIEPDLILLGKDQDIDGRRIKAGLRKRGLDVKIIRSRVWDSGELSKTTRIFERIAKDIHG